MPVDCDETRWTVRYDGNGGYVKWAEGAGGTGLKYKQTVDK